MAGTNSWVQGILTNRPLIPSQTGGNPAQLGTVASIAEADVPDDEPPFVTPGSFCPNISFKESVGSTYCWSPTGEILATGCQHCFKPGANACMKCHIVHYCSKECQRVMWKKEHKDNCGKSYADRLDTILRENLPPMWYKSSYATFGFLVATTRPDLEALRQVYLELLNEENLGVNAETLVNWAENNALKENILKEHVLLASRNTGDLRFSAWFAKHSDLLDKNKPQHDMYLTAWRGLKLPKVRDAKQYASIVSAWTDTEARCFMLYHKLFYGMAPDAGDENYRFFGFCVCHPTDHPTLAHLGKLYVDLIKRSSFQEFVNAINNNNKTPARGDEPGLIKLFKAKGLGAAIRHIPYLSKVLFSREFHQAVWYLKQYVASKHDHWRPDGFFGYSRQMTDEDDKHLSDIYHDYLITHRGDPMALHKACVDDTIYDCVKAILPDLDMKYKGIMANGSKRIEGVDTDYCGCIDNIKSGEMESIRAMIPAEYGLDPKVAAAGTVLDATEADRCASEYLVFDQS